MKPPSQGICLNPIAGLYPEQMRAVSVGVSIQTLALDLPADEGPFLCLYNGEWLSRLTPTQRAECRAIRDAGGDDTELVRVYANRADNWLETITRPEDVIGWYAMPPSDRELGRTLLQVALIASIFIPGLQGVSVYGLSLTTVLAAANLAYNILLPPKTPEFQTLGPANNIYNASLSGNQARIDQPIWKVCGRVKITPPFAGQPYFEFLPQDASDPEGESDQYYYALFALGVGEHDLEKAFIGKTPIRHFADVTWAAYLAPGEAPTQVLPNVVTSTEVSGSALELKDGRYVGGYAVCRPNDRVTHVGIDVAASEGLGVGVDPITVTWRVEIREIDDLGGKPIGAWSVLAEETRTRATNTPLRWSKKYELSTPIRCEVRLVRTNNTNVDPNARDRIEWIGLRGYKSGDAPLNQYTAHYEVVMRASAQLSNQSQTDFAVILRGRVRTWNPDTGWGDAVFTRNAAWWLADLWTSTTWGEGLPESRVDLQGLYDWSLTLDERQDRFDFCFQSAKSSWEAAQLIAKSGRAAVFRRQGVFTVQRDELEDVPIMAITSRIAEPKSMQLHERLPAREQPDGIVVEYLSNVTWDTLTIECPCPGFTYTDPTHARYDYNLPQMSAPTYITLEGVTGAKHAEREGTYQAYAMALRTVTASARVEMEGVLLTYGDPVRWQPDIKGYGQCGDVAFWDEATLTLSLSEQPDFSVEPIYLTLQRDDGSLTDPVVVTAGPGAWDVILPAIPDFDFTLDDATRERAKFILGPITTGDELVKISAVGDGGRTDGGAQLFDLSGVVDDERVHTADNYLLPGPGELQDPIDDGAEADEGSGGLILVRLADTWIGAGNEIVGLSTDGGGNSAGVTFNTDGTATIAMDPFGIWYTWTLGGALGFYTQGTTDLQNQWMQFPVETSTAALYEIRAVDVSGYGWFHGDPTDTWLPLTAAHNWYIANDEVPPPGDRVDSPLRIEIRLIGETALQGSATFHLSVAVADYTP